MDAETIAHLAKLAGDLADTSERLGEARHRHASITAMVPAETLAGSAVLDLVNGELTDALAVRAQAWQAWVRFMKSTAVSASAPPLAECVGTACGFPCAYHGDAS